MNKRLLKLFGFILVLALALPFAAKSALAESTSTATATGAPKEVVATITDFRIEDRFGNPTTLVNKANVYAIAMTWDASGNANVEPGDYFDVVLPETMRFTAAHPASTFNITDATTGEVMATAHVSPGTDGFGGTMRVVFTDYVNNHTDLRGTARLGFTISNHRIQSGNNRTVNFTVSGRIVPITFDLTEPGTVGTEYLAKWGKPIEGNPNEIQWTGRINFSGGHLNGVHLHDQLYDWGGGDLPAGITYVPGSFELWGASFDAYGSIIPGTAHQIPITPNMLTISPDGQSFDMDLSSVDFSNGQSYKFTYRTTYVPGVALRNLIKMFSDQPVYSSDWTYRNATSGGEGTSTLVARIRIIKVDKDDHTKKLAGAVFKVTSATDSSKTWTITTGEDGSATTEKLPAGAYTVQEITAPSGYQLNSNVYNLTVSETSGVIKTIEDEKSPSVDIKVKKTWVGTIGGPVTAKLYKDGVATTQTVVLDATNNWSAVFTGLPRYDTADGHLIAYTVQEDDVPAGYTSAISGDATDGFTITNTEIPPTIPPTPTTPPSVPPTTPPSVPPTTPPSVPPTTPTTPPSETPKKPAKKQSKLPNTGDFSNVALVAMTTFGSVVSAIALGMKNRNKK